MLGFAPTASLPNSCLLMDSPPTKWSLDKLSITFESFVSFSLKIGNSCLLMCSQGCCQFTYHPCIKYLPTCCLSEGHSQKGATEWKQKYLTLWAPSLLSFCGLQTPTPLKAQPRFHLTESQGPHTGFSDKSSLSAEKAMAPHSSTLAQKIPWMEEPGGLWSMG